MCTTTEAAYGPQDCPSEHCVFQPGPDYPDSFVGNRCIPRQTKQCARAWSNPDQLDSDGDGIGDRMDPTPRVRDVFFGRSSFFSPLSCSDHVVAFGTTGGEVYADHTKVDDDDGYLIPQFTSVYRDGVNVGACQCTLQLQNGEWHEDCDNEDLCPGTTETQQQNSRTIRTWNPVNAPQAMDGHLTPNPSYPVAEGLEPGEIRDNVETRALMYARKMGFSHDPGRAGAHSLDWHAHSSTEFYSWSPIDWPAQKDMARTKLRVAWPPFALIQEPSANVVAFSQSGPTSGDCGLLGRLAGIDSSIWNTYPEQSTELLLKEELVVGLIPGVAESRLAQGSVLRPQVSRPGYFIGREPLSGAFHLYALGSCVTSVGIVSSSLPRPRPETLGPSGRHRPDESHIPA